MDKLNKLTNDDIFMSDLERLQWEEWERRSIEKAIRKEATEQGLEEGRIKGLSEGRAEGRAENTIITIQAMLENGLDYEIISKVTNKSIDEIKEIEKSME